MRIINIVDRLDRVNFGIWNAAIATAGVLLDKFGVESEIWYPESTCEAEPDELNGAKPRGLKELNLTGLENNANATGLNPATDVIVSHGCWQYPTRWGKALHDKGFAWMAVPHGMLEAWSLAQKRWRKWLYFRLLEKRLLLQADSIRAVGKPEFKNLQKHFRDQLIWIPNGVPSLPADTDSVVKPAGKSFLFMARLHHKKGILPLVQGWKQSVLNNQPGAQLNIAGPDDGELDNLQRFLNQNKDVTNIRYLGAVYGEQKERLLKDSHFYTLPSHSEGFPTSVLEAMQNGLVPLVSAGCNFPDVFEEHLGIQIEPDPGNIRQGLDKVAEMKNEELDRISQRAVLFIENNYTHPELASKLNDALNRLLTKTEG